MHAYPHVYRVSATAPPEGLVRISAPDLPAIDSTPPPQFDGPPGFWSPETLLCAAVADCLVLTFRGVARGARLQWQTLECRVEGTLARVEGQSRFTHFAVLATLLVPDGADAGEARKLLERAEQVCLVSNSLRATRTLEVQVSIDSSQEHAA
jgi:organic hydroperoxide reductase OsmC/OhrA